MKEVAPKGQIGIPEYSSERSNPRNLDAAVETKVFGTVFRMQSHLRFLTEHRHLDGPHLVSSWMRRQIAPLQSRDCLMWGYTGAVSPVYEVARLIRRVTSHSLEELGDPTALILTETPPETSKELWDYPLWKQLQE